MSTNLNNQAEDQASFNSAWTPTLTGSYPWVESPGIFSPPTTNLPTIPNTWPGSTTPVWSGTLVYTQPSAVLTPPTEEQLADSLFKDIWESCKHSIVDANTVQAIITAITPYLEALQEANKVLVNHNKELKQGLKEIERVAAEASAIDLEDVELLDGTDLDEQSHLQ